jgi:hypothetical protein
MTPNYLNNIILWQRNQGHNYNTRTSHPLQEINSRTNLYYNSFSPATIRKWNALPQIIQSNSSLSHFKRYLNSGSTTVPNYFYLGTRIGQTLHAKLRLECSSLNLQKKNCIIHPFVLVVKLKALTMFFYAVKDSLELEIILLWHYLIYLMLNYFYMAKIIYLIVKTMTFFIQSKYFLFDSKRFWDACKFAVLLYLLLLLIYVLVWICAHIYI